MKTLKLVALSALWLTVSLGLASCRCGHGETTDGDSGGAGPEPLAVIDCDASCLALFKDRDAAAGGRG